MDRKTVETCSLVSRVHILFMFGEKQTSDSMFQKMKKTIQAVANKKLKKPASVMVWECISAHGMGDLHICEGTIDVEAYVGILERCCRQDNDFS